MDQYSAEDVNGYMWLREKWPKLRTLDVDWTMAKYEYPSYVRNFIFKFWKKIGQENGGVYERPYEY